MKTRNSFGSVSTATVFALVSAFLASSVSPVFAASKKANVASKVYVSDVSGEAIIDTGETSEDVTKRSVYSAEGTVIETKRATDTNDRKRTYSTMVYSNGTGAYFDEDTRVEVRKFNQEPFTPNRTDIEAEPSQSQTNAFVTRGAVGLCNSKLVSGSTMTYATAQGSVNIRGRKLVIEAQQNVTKISMLEGESTVKGGLKDLGGHSLKAGEQAIIRTGAPGQPNQVQIIKIPEKELAALDDKVAMACMAKKSVYFEVKEKREDSGIPTPGAAKGETTAPGPESSDNAGTPITAFNSVEPKPTPREIVAIEVTPVNAPVSLTLSASRVEEPKKPGT